MLYKEDIKSGNMLSALGLGCMRFPGTLGNIDMQKAEAVVMEAIQSGINFFDTAYIYPGSEVALGKILAKNNIRDKVFVATKLPLFKCRNYNDFDKFFYQQLERLQTNYIDYYFMHNITQLADWSRLQSLGIEDWLAEKRASGEVKSIGFSYHGTRDVFPILLEMYNWDFCMIQYNYVNTNYQAGESGLKLAHAKGMSVFIMEPLLGGMLARELPKAALNVIARYEASEGKGQPKKSPAGWALTWLWNQPEVTMVLSGMGTTDQVKENATYATNAKDNGMSQHELQVIEKVAKIFSDSYKIPCTGCGYCLPCPAKISIPECFMSYNSSYAISRMTGIQQFATSSGALTRGFSILDCTKCGKCEKACPQEIKIVQELTTVRKRLEPWWYRAGVAIARKFMR